MYILILTIFSQRSILPQLGKSENRSIIFTTLKMNTSDTKEKTD